MSTRFSHTVITGPLVEPVTLADVKTAAHVNFDCEDAIISRWISSARRAAENYQRRAYINQTLEMRFDCWPSFPLSLYRAPLQSVSAIKYYDTDGAEYTLDSSDYIVDTSSAFGRVGLAYGVTLPTVTLQPMDAVSVRYVAGYGPREANVPDYVKDAIFLYCAWRYENRTGETDIPQAFYDLLEPEALFA